MWIIGLHGLKVRLHQGRVRAFQLPLLQRRPLSDNYRHLCVPGRCQLWTQVGNNYYTYMLHPKISFIPKSTFFIPKSSTTDPGAKKILIEKIQQAGKYTSVVWEVGDLEFCRVHLLVGSSINYDYDYSCGKHLLIGHLQPILKIDSPIIAVRWP